MITHEEARRALRLTPYNEQQDTFLDYISQQKQLSKDIKRYIELSEKVSGAGRVLINKRFSNDETKEYIDLHNKLKGETV